MDEQLADIDTLGVEHCVGDELGDWLGLKLWLGDGVALGLADSELVARAVGVRVAVAESLPPRETVCVGVDAWLVVAVAVQDCDTVAAPVDVIDCEGVADAEIGASASPRNASLRPAVRRSVTTNGWLAGIR